MVASRKCPWLNDGVMTDTLGEGGKGVHALILSHNADKTYKLHGLSGYLSIPKRLVKSYTNFVRRIFTYF